jgi:hypothetical protein
MWLDVVAGPNPLHGARRYLLRLGDRTAAPPRPVGWWQHGSGQNGFLRFAVQNRFASPPGCVLQSRQALLAVTLAP